jgi:3'-phosphoadenosine 5'-phosphosulfate sulfotransferase (PAPS reductase)/FAD synthetase
VQKKEVEMSKNASVDKPVIAWWSGGVTSAVACKMALDMFGIENVRLIFIDTFNEDQDTYRFKSDCERWYGKDIESISSNRYKCITDVWEQNKSLNVAHGAVCSDRLKTVVRKEFLKSHKYYNNIFGYDIDEPKRAKSMALNYPEIKPVFPLLFAGLTKKDCIRLLNQEGLTIPRAYEYGLNNNNCLNTGCVQGGIGYWQLMRKLFPEKFEKMAAMEHKLTDVKGEPVTMLKDQSKGGGLVFLLPHPKYPHIKDISMMKGRPPKPLTECNGFCGINDLAKKNPTYKELNYHQ